MARNTTVAADTAAPPVTATLAREVSVSPPQVGEIKDRVRHLDAAQCQRISTDLLNLASAAAVRQACHQHWPLG